MSLYKRGGVWWFAFYFNGERIQESSKTSNRRTAEQIQAARKTELAKGEVGIEKKKPVPTLKEFAPRFMEAIETDCAEKPNTIGFYREKLSKLLAYPAFADAKLDTIEEAAIDAYKNTRTRTNSRFNRPLSVASVNRELATLRRLLRLAQEWKVINRVPRVRLLRGEKNREFVLSQIQEPVYLAALPEPLRDVALLLVDTGLRLGEACSLEWPQVHLEPAKGATFGYLTVLSGKAKSKKSRNVPLSPRVSEMLGRWRRASGHVFHKNGKPLAESLLGQQQARVRELLKMPKDFVLHSLRHTFGTRLGESGCDAFGIMKLMGHSSVTVSQRYVHPSPEALELAFGRMIGANMETPATVSATVKAGSIQIVQ
jgi:integrase